MLGALVRFSVRHRGIVIGLGLAVVVYGLRVLAGAKLDVFPEFAPPQVSIQTEAPGFSAEQVEILVTKPIEDAINGVNGIAAVRSQSIQGLSVHYPMPKPSRWPIGSSASITGSQRRP